MKLLFAVLLIAFASSGVLTLPARNSPQDDAEVISDPKIDYGLERIDPTFRDFKGVIDTGSANPFLQSIPSPFHVGFFDQFDDIFRRLRTRLWPVAVAAGSDEDSDAGSGDSSLETGFPLGFGLRGLTPLDTKNANTTSTIKVVDGHRLEINETVYGDSNNVIKVRVVNVRPLESGEDVVEGVINNDNNNAEVIPVSSPSTSAPPKRSELDDESDEDSDRREPLEKQPRDNEVRDIDGSQSTTTVRSTLAEDSIADSTDNRHIIMADLMEDVQRTEEEVEEQQQEEQLLAAQDAGTMAHNEETEMPQHDSDSHNAAPESEAIENFGDETESELADPSQSESQQMPSQSHSQLQLHREREELESSDDEEDVAAPIEMSDTFNDEWATLDGEIADPGNDLNNHIDIYEQFVPVDLSNDIAVNDAAAANPDFPHNPDAELIEAPAAVQAMPKFEKLTLMPPTPLLK